ncbi:MAG: glycosyltransferase family 39 protein [Acidobacteriota bacterium]
MTESTGIHAQTTEARLAWAVLLMIAGGKLALHLATNHNYGYFIDEFYYLACARHLDFGYVDHPPLIALTAWLATALFGESARALRLLPALFGAMTVFLSGVVAWRMGGGRFAQALAALAVTVSPLLLFMNTILSMNALDVLIWTLAAFILVLLLNGGTQRLTPTHLWLLLGVVTGIGLQNKISVLFLGFGLGAGFVLTAHRRMLLTRGPWLAAAVAGVIFLPHVLWQIGHGWPTLEFMHNATTLKNRPLSPIEFVAGQALEAHPLNLVLLLLCLWWFMFSRQGRSYRIFGWAYIAIFAVFLVSGGKPYYMGPIYPLMFAGGACGTAGLLARVRHSWPHVAVIFAMIAGGAVFAPMTLPVLPVEKFIAYQQFLLGGTLASSERKEVGLLPQHFADMLGHEERVALIAQVFQGLPPQDRARCGIFCGEYCYAGAVDLFGGRFGLPSAISGQNSYWLWGPGSCDGEVLIVIGEGIDGDDLRETFREVHVARIFRHPYLMPCRNNLPIFVCRGIKRPLADVWQETKKYE